jgi:catechol 2,3-dioxygenase-like lactoylglutathione lyase family enzyme
MILYSTVGTADMERAVKFYDAVFGALGVARAPNWIDGWAGWGGSYDEGYGFWICKPFDGRVPTSGNGTMVTLGRPGEANIRCWYAQANSTPARPPIIVPSFLIVEV